MALDLAMTSQLAPYDDEEEIQLMDTDLTNLQEEEQFVNTTESVVNEEKQEENNDIDELEKTDDKIPSLLVIEKLKVYIRDGPNKHHVEAIPFDEKYYEIPTTNSLASVKLTEEEIKDIWQSLNLTQEDFRTSLTPTGISRPESLYVRGVTNMGTQDILNCFEEFQPIGIEWICDHSCNVFWYDSLTPIHLLATMTKPGPCISHRRPVDFDHAMRLSKRKSSSLTSTDSENNSAEIALPPGHWREGNFPLVNKPEPSIKFYLRYTTMNDRKVRGAENQSEYYRQYGNPNYNNMTGLISRSKKRSLNAMKLNPFRDFTVVKSNDPTSYSSSVVEELTTTEDSTTDPKVKFTVVLPPKKSSPSRETEEDDEGEHRSKRQRRRSIDTDEDRQHKEKPHFTVTIDPASKHTKHSRNKTHETSKANKDNDEDDDTLAPVTDARQILERKRRNRR
ncbi:unnamed protein product [Rotaria socialis]|uniref:Nuclear cap-binding protein subunit 3 n=2 Tax=Rotaria socialis TaxID=392032 RepID=A0A817XC47_9BILA|nr:unnamed protein product [Rotaria socialis]CAF4526109.1 unnamed protein product [Rotaria socialis]